MKEDMRLLKPLAVSILCELMVGVFYILAFVFVIADSLLLTVTFAMFSIICGAIALFEKIRFIVKILMR